MVKMVYCEQLADRLRVILSAFKGVTEKKCLVA